MNDCWANFSINHVAGLQHPIFLPLIVQFLRTSGYSLLFANWSYLSNFTMADTEPPPSYHSVFAKIEQNVGEKPSPDKLLAVVDALSPAEKQAIDNKKFNKATVMQGADHTAFQKGVNDYLASEAAQIRLKTNADEAANACKLIDTMFTALTVKLGEVDAKSPAPTEKFSPKLADLQKVSPCVGSRIHWCPRGTNGLILGLAP